MESPNQLAGIVLDAFASQRLVGLPSASDPGLDERGAYAIADAVHRRRVARGETPVGRKIGFTNRTLWERYGVSAPMWAWMYDATVHHAPDREARVSVGHLLQPLVEPEIQLHFARTPPVTGDEAAILECVDWISFGYELVQCPYPEWRFEAVDSIAAGGLHGALVAGPPVAVHDAGDWPARLRGFTVSLGKPGEAPVLGGGANVLDSPLLAFAHLAAVLAEAGAPPVQAGEIVTTGTLTAPLPVAPGDTLTATLEGIELPAVSLVIA